MAVALWLGNSPDKALSGVGEGCFKSFFCVVNFMFPRLAAWRNSYGQGRSLDTRLRPGSQFFNPFAQPNPTCPVSRRHPECVGTTQAKLGSPTRSYRARLATTPSIYPTQPALSSSSVARPFPSHFSPISATTPVRKAGHFEVARSASSGMAAKIRSM